MKDQIYKIEYNLQQEKERLRRENIDQRVITTFLDFIDEINVQNLTKHRQYFYLVKLRTMGKILDEKILCPEKEDIKKMIATLKNTTTKRHKEYAENSIKDFLTTLKKFYKWHEEGKYLPTVSWIKTRTMASQQEKPDFVITELEIAKMIKACKNTRDKALISLLYDSGCRIGELLTMKKEDIQFDEYGASLLVQGKTGSRWVRVVGNSVPLTREHISTMEKGEYVFQTMEGEKKGTIMKYPSVSRLLSQLQRRAGIKRRIYPHLFRHTRATLLATNLKEAPLESQMGWTHGSKMTQTYVHFSRADLDKAVLKAYGIEIPDSNNGTGETLPRKCERCSMINETDSKFCKRCGLPLDREILAKYDEGKRTIEKELLESTAIDDTTKIIIKNFDGAFKDKILEAVLQQMIGNPEIMKTFSKKKRKTNKTQ